jgi:hypothetical protein
MSDKDGEAEAANRKERMGPGERGGGYASQRFDIDRHGGSYGGNEGAGGGHFAEPGGRAKMLKGQQHMSGRYGDKAYGRTDGVSSNIPRDPSQHHGPVTASGGARPADAGQNAQIGGGSPTPKISAGRENERDAPGISTDKRSDDTKP